MKRTEIDWSKAPNDATDYNVDNEMWYKEDSGLMYFWSDASSKWKMGGKREEYSVDGKSTFISRIKEVNTSLIGKITGANWDNAPVSATHVCKQNPSNFYKVGDKGWLCFWDMGESTFSSNEFSNKGSLSNGIKLLVSKEDDLQLETKPKYSSLQELPVGTFVKLRGETLPIYLWGGNKGMLSLAQSGYHGSFKDQCSRYEGLKYAPNPMFDIVSYSDRYDGDYTSVVEVVAEVVVPKKEQVVPEAIKQGWKIKHIKHPDYKCGRDVAVTILYRDSTWYQSGLEWKYSICSHKDMFNRKKGINEALKRTSVVTTGIIKENQFKDILRAIRKHVGYTPTPQFEELFNWYCNNH